MDRLDVSMAGRAAPLMVLGGEVLKDLDRFFGRAWLSWQRNAEVRFGGEEFDLYFLK